MSKIFSATLASLAFVFGIGVGYVLTPEYSMLKNSPTHNNGLGNPDRYLNLRFINGMIAHHLSAIDMLEQVKKNSDRNELRKMAENVIKIDTEGVVHLYGLKKDIYQDKRKIKRFDKLNLGVRDKNFDLRFLNAMIIHHEEAIKSSREVMVKSFDQRVLDTAGAVDVLLSENLVQLKKWREEWYGVK